MNRLPLRQMVSQPPDISTLYAAHATQVWRTLLRLGVAPRAVEDCVQDVFLIAHQRLATFVGESKSSTWLVGIAVRVAANGRRRMSLRRETEVDDSHLDPALPADVKLEQASALRELDRVLSRLPDELRAVVVLIDLEQLSAPEAADALTVKLNTVYSRLRRGRALLNTAMKQFEGEAP